MQASDVTSRVGRALYDTDNVRWPVVELLEHITDAERMIVQLLPDANAVNEAVQLVTGTRQQLPADGIRLMRVTRNMGEAGTTPGRVIYPTTRDSLDAELPDWHESEGSEIEHYIYDPGADRTRFYVYPGVPDGENVYVEVVYSALPAEVVTESQVLTLGDQYLPAVLDWVLYRCWSKDADYAGNTSRAMAHQQSFYQQLGVKFQAAARVDPNRRVRGGEAMSG